MTTQGDGLFQSLPHDITVTCNCALSMSVGFLEITLLFSIAVRFKSLNTYSNGNFVLDLLCAWKFIAKGDLVQQAMMRSDFLRSSAPYRRFVMSHQRKIRN